jgi:hypothetical protein
MRHSLAEYVTTKSVTSQMAASHRELPGFSDVAWAGFRRNAARPTRMAQAVSSAMVETLAIASAVRVNS